MVQSTFISTVAALMLAALPLVAAAEPLQKPGRAAVLGGFTSQGCFGTGQGLKKQKIVNGTENSSASCGALCLEQTKLVFAMTGDACYCGDKYPPKVDIVDDSKCTYKCKGNKKEACGSKSDKRYSVWNSGVKVDVDYAKKKTSTSTKTGTKSATKTPTSTKSSKSTKTSKSTKKTPSTTTTAQSETTTSDTVVSTSSSGNVPSGTSAAAQTSNTSGAVSRPMIGAGAAVLAAALAI
ncbi:unnamed protein product [Clonostachys solani]|uniref:WSC domain-containing protein n=1 Tax=Clonostachys solani TaxID=160281 RepID=A0A9N9Z282_9HYPO|nr:unnamed protein product [Clonostachys solani]